MKKKLSITSVVILVLLGIVLMFFQFKQMENTRLLEERRQEVKDNLVNHLSDFNPTLDAFVDDDYKTTIATQVSSEGLCEFERGLAKNQSPFGNYIVKFDLKNMELISEELIVTNPKYSEQWLEFKEANKN
ncbi:MAG: hypothetical protein ACK4M9_22265 [Anaerobacillus sp.]|uniref:hypothetical protein n=1 Tax=Anaerobacillus sp. TaxID=1872506 RepID=UPI003919E42B